MQSCCEENKKYRKTERDESQYKDIKKRINRILGQLNGVSKMLDENRYCGDILLQVSAIENALQQLGFVILKEHLKTCVVSDIKNDDYSSLEESVELMRKLK